jgi:pilus assembly protein Flp/PilA
VKFFDCGSLCLPRINEDQQNPTEVESFGLLACLDKSSVTTALTNKGKPAAFLTDIVITANNKPEDFMLKKFLQDEQGQDIVEYSLLLVLIGAAAVFVLTAMGTNIGAIFSKINTKLSSANASISQ